MQNPENIPAHVTPLNNPKGWIVTKTVNGTTYYLNQASGGWSSFATVYNSEDVANEALNFQLIGFFKSFKTNEVDFRSDH